MRIQGSAVSFWVVQSGCDLCFCLQCCIRSSKPFPPSRSWTYCFSYLCPLLLPSPLHVLSSAHKIILDVVETPYTMDGRREEEKQINRWMGSESHYRMFCSFGGHWNIVYYWVNLEKEASFPRMKWMWRLASISAILDKRHGMPSLNFMYGLDPSFY